MVAFDEKLKKQDEWYTPCYAVFPIVKYLKPGSHVWCPFDTDKSNFVKVLRKRGFKVTNTHLEMGVDFFTAEPPEGCDYIVSNPPYSLKTKVFKRLSEIGKPFAMLVGCLGIFENQRFHIFSQLGGGVEILVFNKRVSYFQDYGSQDLSTATQPPFASWYVCNGVLPRQIVFEELRHGKGDVDYQVSQVELI